MKNITEHQIRTVVKDTAREIIDDLSKDPDTDRDMLIERMDEEHDALFVQLVGHGRIDQYDVSDLARTAPACATILLVAEADAYVENDGGLWQGLTYGVLASIAYYSLRNLLYVAMKAEGVDSNNDRPFAEGQ